MVGFYLFLFLAPILLISFFARIRSSKESTSEAAIPAWQLAISAAATGNSGFIMTGAVGLGYAFGMQWVLLPLAWMLGDLAFWFFKGPGKLVSASKERDSVEIAALLGDRNGGKTSKLTYWLVVLISAILLGSYVTAQWVAGQKVIESGFEVSNLLALLIAGGFVGLYSLIGGFKGSVWTDLYQAILILILTVLSLVLVTNTALASAFEPALSIDADFLSLNGNMGIIATSTFIIGWAFSAIGFGFGQPHIASRYIAALSPDEIQRTKWIYIGFLQFTWIGMTVFGVLLRLSDIEITDGEKGVVSYLSTLGSPFLIALALAGILSTIASTIDSIIISLKRMVAPRSEFVGFVFSIILIATSLSFAFYSQATVFEIAIFAVSVIGGSLGGVVLVRAMGLPHTQLSILVALVLSFAVTLSWTFLGLSNSSGLNEALPGIITGILASVIIAQIKPE